MTTVSNKLMTAEELLMLPKGDGRRFELIRGVLIERMPGGKSQGLVNSRIDAAGVVCFRGMAYDSIVP